MSLRPSRRITRSPLLLLLVCLTIMLLPTRAAAVPKKNSTAATAFAEGMKHYRQTNYLKAIDAFDRSYALHPHFLTQCNIARCHERLSDMVRAARHYRRCLKEGGESSGTAQEMQKALKSVEGQMATVTIESPGTPPAEVFVDGAPVGKTPLQIELNPGPHEIEVRRPNARPEQTTVQLDIGERRTVVLHTASTAVPPTGGTLPQGDDRPGPRKTGLSPVWFWSAAGLTAALALTTTVLGIMTLQSNSAYEDDPTEDRYNRVLDLRLGTNVCIGLTAAAAAGTTFVFLYTDFRSGKETRDDRGRAFVIGVQGRF